MKCFTTLLGGGSMVLCCVLCCYAQSTTVQSGTWSSPSTWSGGIVPDASTGSITILHDVAIPADTSMMLDELAINAVLTIEPRATVTLRHKPGASPDLVLSSGRLHVYGRLVCQDSALIFGATATNLFFQDGSTYEHQYYNSASAPPLATWDKNSTIALTGFRSSRSLNSSGWSQSFGNLLYDCPNQQSSSFIEMLGNVNAVRGNFTVRNTNGGVLRITLDRTALTTINIGGNLVIEGNSEVWLSRAGHTQVIVGGNFEYKSTATPSSYITTTGTSELRVAGDVLINSPGILRFASSGGGHGTLSTMGNFTLTRGTLAVLPVGDGKIVLNGNSKTFSAATAIAAGIDIELGNSSRVSISSSLTTGGGLILRSGSELQFPNADLSFGGNILLEPNASIKANTSRVILNGQGNQSINLAGDTLHHLTLNKPGGTSVIFSGATRLRGRLSISSSGTTLQSGGNLALLSASDDGLQDASVGKIPAGSSIQGPVTVQRFMKGEGRIYRYISSPVVGATIDSLQDDFPVTGTFDDPSTGPGINSNNPSMFMYDELLDGAQGWIAYPTEGLARDHELKTGVGYSAFIRQASLPTTWDVTGVLHQGEIDIPVSYHDSDDNANDGWNLVGNPFASAIDWDIDEGWEKTNVLPGIVLRDNGGRRFLYWDGEVGSLGNGRIASGQSFWVRTNSINPALSINESAKTELQAPFYRADRQPDFVELTVAGNGNYDQSYLRLRSGAHKGLDGFDIVKFFNDVVNLSFPADSLKLAIDASQKVSCSEEVPIHLDFQKQNNGSWVQSPFGNYVFTTSSSGLFGNSSITLIDKLLNTEHDLAHPYAFTIGNNQEAERNDRFSVRFDVDPIAPIEISGDSIACPDVEYPLSLFNLQHGVRYALHINGEEVFSFLNEESTSIRTIDPSWFTHDKNLVTVTAESICETSIKTLWVTRLKKPDIVEKGGTLYGNQSANLFWFEAGNEVPLLTGESFRPSHSGEYQLTVRGGQCEESAFYHFFSQSESLQIFPVPVAVEVNIIPPAGEKLLGFSMTDVFGKEVLRMELSPVEKLLQAPLPNVSAGVYLISVATDRAVYKRRISVE